MILRFFTHRPPLSRRSRYIRISPQINIKQKMSIIPLNLYVITFSKKKLLILKITYHQRSSQRERSAKRNVYSLTSLHTTFASSSSTSSYMLSWQKRFMMEKKQKKNISYKTTLSKWEYKKLKINANTLCIHNKGKH